MIDNFNRHAFLFFEQYSSMSYQTFFPANEAHLFGGRCFYRNGICFQFKNGSNGLLHQCNVGLNLGSL